MSDYAVVRCVLNHKGARFVATHGYLCDDHAAQVNETLTDIEELYAIVMLESAIPLPSVAPSDSKHTKSAEAPAPVRLDVLSLTETRGYSGVRHPEDLLVYVDGQGRPRVESPDIPNPARVLNSWAQAVCEERELTGTTLDGTVVRAVAFLRAHREWVYAQPWVDEYWRELRGLKSLLAGMLGQQPPKPIGRCPTMVGDGPCGGPLWPDQYGKMEVTCGACQRVYDETMLRHLGGMMEAS